VQTTDSLFSTSDANGPFRRALFGLSCETIKNQLATTPVSGPLLGLSNAINDPVLCGNNNNSSSPITIPPLPKRSTTDGKSGSSAGGTDAAPSGSSTAPANTGTTPAPSTPAVPGDAAPATPAIPKVKP
jgi:hypothetical protein